jgi:hypothetical protein
MKMMMELLLLLLGLQVFFEEEGDSAEVDGAGLRPIPVKASPIWDAAEYSESSMTWTD